MKFKMSLIPYEVNADWIEPTLMQIKECFFHLCPNTSIVSTVNLLMRWNVSVGVKNKVLRY